MRRLLLLVPFLALAACAGGGGAPTAAVPAPAAPTFTTAGLERVLGADAAGLGRLFGDPQADVREGTARKLQYASAICVLDAYLYPREGGGGEPVVSYLDARQPDGRDIDRASCVAALTRRSGGR